MVAAELLCLEEASTGSSYKGRRGLMLQGYRRSQHQATEHTLTVSTSTAPCRRHLAWSLSTCSQSFTAGRNGVWMPARASERLSLQ